jgi:diacylglycerol diphosphate phosphatase/phosphatidate phosphatase
MIPSSPADNDSIASEPSLLAATAATPRTLVHYCYTSPQQIGEMMLSIAIFALGKAIPFVFDSVFTWTSPIPYETTQDGEVLLELDLSYELVSVETVPDWLASILCILFPILLFIIVGFRTGPRGDMHASMCCFLITVGLSWFLTDMIKIYTGQLRPNFYEMCNFNKQTLECETDSAHLLKESRRSFPSGHASLAFSSMTTLTLYLIGKVGIQRHVHSKRITLCTRVWYLLSFLPMLLAFFVAASRVHDFWHHPADVVAGSAIGIGCALSIHGMWYAVHFSWVRYAMLFFTHADVYTCSSM